MDPKRTGAASRRVAVRVVLAGMVLFLIRLVYVVVVHGESCDSGDFCFFSTRETTVAVSRRDGGRAFLRGTAAGVQNPAWSSREWRKAVDFYSSAFQDLILEGFLSRDSKALCVGSAVGHEVFALKEIGVPDAIGVSRKKSRPLVVSGDLFDQPFEDETFEFIFVGVGVIESSKRPGKVAEELKRILKPGWFLVVHTDSAGDVYSLSSFKSLFPSLVLVRSRETVDGLSGLKIRELVLQKEGNALIKTRISSDVVEKCVIPLHKIELVESAEPLIQEEPLKPWITLKKNAQSIKYLPSMADISFKSRYVYVDVGSRSYGSSIGSWFRKRYPKQNKTFEVYAIEADEAFHAEYATKKGVTLMPFAAWVRNETLSFEVSHNPEDHDNERKGLGMGRIRSVTEESGSGHVQSIQGFDFAEWLKSTVTETDFVVMKMDVEGTEFDLLPRLFETGAICLVDELFLECHYNRWQRCCPGERSPKYQKTYEECLDLFSSLRESGVLVHQWW